MADEWQSRFQMLERAVLDLGTEVYQLKGTIAKADEYRSQLLGVMKGLKQLLDEKGLITLEDFDAAVELGDAIERFNAGETSFAPDGEKIKKSSH